MRKTTRRRFGLLLAIGLVIGTASSALGQSAGTQRALRNIELALNMEVAESFRSGTIPPGKEFEARTLAKDLEDRIPRARRDFDRIDAADRSHPAVIAVGKRLEEM